MKRSFISIVLFSTILSLFGENLFSTNQQLTDRIEVIADSISIGCYETFLPELLEMKDSLEHQNVLDAYNYVHVIMCLNNIYAVQQDLEKFRNSIDDAFNFFEKIGQKEDPSVRTLYLSRSIFWGYMDNQLEAKKDLEYAKPIYEQVNDTTEEYASCLLNLATVLVSENEALDLVNAHLYLEEAMEIMAI